MQNGKFKDTINLTVPNQQEAQAARLYWKALFGSNFCREPKGDTTLNAALNYGYSILRAMVARSLVASGLLPLIGLHHQNQYNPYCLADDVMEPYRPFVDRLVLQCKLDIDATQPLSKTMRLALLAITTVSVLIPAGRSTLIEAIGDTSASLRKALEEKDSKLLSLYSLS